jgi:acetyl-CoA carboxylase, biotin carboxylase subunit
VFKKILIANRGEIALRIIRTCKEMGIKTVAVYSTADKESLHVRFADEAVCIGPPPSKDSYLNIPSIISAAEITNADAIHPGYGFLSENAKFSGICEEHEIKFIGASPDMINRMGDKSSAKATMKKAKVPTIPGSDGLLESFEEGIKVAKKIGYPVIIKATAGGGGRGMRIIWKPEDFEAAWDSARQEAGAAFGNDGMYLEKYIEEPRHIEIQVVGDQNGKACHLSERDCSIQRRHQKLLEETPSPFMTDKLRKQMGEAAVKAALAIKYEGVGTVEFLVDKHRNFYFMEMNTRIQVEHPITEEVINYDLIKEQIKVAAGVPITGRNYVPLLHAIECRINAEDPFNNFKPCPGRITTLHVPGGHGVRVDSHIYAGYNIPPNYDSMIAKLITVAQTREEAINTMERALSEFVIEGVKTTIPLHIRLMQDKDFRKGIYTTKFMENFNLKE